MIKQLVRAVAVLALGASTLLVAHPVTHVFADAPKYDVSDPEIADFAAHLMVLSDEELPGTGWEVTKKDDFTKSPNPNIQACKDSSDKLDALTAKIEKNRVAHANTELTKDSGGLLPLQVQSEVELYKSNSDTDGLVAAAKPLIGGTAFTQCLEASIQQDSPDARVKRVDPSSAAPGDGGAAAFQVDFPSLKSTIRLELYAWVDKNATVSVSFFGDPKQINAGFTDATLASVQMSMEIVAALSN